MPVAGVVITTRPDDLDQTRRALAAFAAVEVHGSDSRGNIVAVLDTPTLDTMEELVRELEAMDTVLAVGVTYLNTEDECEQMEAGGHRPRIFGMRRGERE